MAARRPPGRRPQRQRRRQTSIWKSARHRRAAGAGHGAGRGREPGQSGLSPDQGFCAVYRSQEAIAFGRGAAAQPPLHHAGQRLRQLCPNYPSNHLVQRWPVGGARTRSRPRRWHPHPPREPAHQPVLRPAATRPLQRRGGDRLSRRGPRRRPGLSRWQTPRTRPHHGRRGHRSDDRSLQRRILRP